MRECKILSFDGGDLVQHELKVVAQRTEHTGYVYQKKMYDYPLIEKELNCYLKLGYTVTNACYCNGLFTFYLEHDI